MHEKTTRSECKYIWICIIAMPMNFDEQSSSVYPLKHSQVPLDPSQRPRPE